MKRVATIALTAAIGVLVIAAPASAHVTVNPKEATQGGYARLAFRVPNESDTAGTTKLEVQLPENAPFGSVSTMPVQGWSVTVTKRKLDKPVEVHGSPISEVVSVITWTATEGSAVKPGEFQEFPVSAGPMPTGVDKLVFKALQTYSDGAVVRWIDTEANAEHPAPVLKLVPASSANQGASASSNATIPLADNKSSGSNALGWAGLGVGVLALILAGLALIRSRRA